MSVSARPAVQRQVKERGRRASPRDIAARVQRQLTHADPRVRRQAALRLFGSRARTLIEPLCAAATDEEWGVRYAALLSLAKPGWTEARPCVAECLGDPRMEVRVVAAVSLARMRATDYWEHLLSGLEDTSPSVRETCAWALGELGAVAAADCLCHLLSDERWEVRWSAGVALTELGDGRGLPVLLELAAEGTVPHDLGRRLPALKRLLVRRQGARQAERQECVEKADGQTSPGARWGHLGR